MNRLPLLRDTFESHDIDGALIGSASNRRYLSGFTGSAGWLVISNQRVCLAVDFRYVEQARQQSPDIEVLYIKGDINNWLADLAADMGICRLGIESDHLSLTTYNTICMAARAAGKKYEVTPVRSLVEKLRAVKDAQEIANITKACSIADRALEQIVAACKVGLTEKQLAWQMESFMRREGSEPLPFDIIAASGPNSALPHASPTDRLISEGEPITIDFGARCGGYCCDITRTYIIGKMDEQFNKVYNTVLGAQTTAIALIKDGMSAGAVDKLVRDMIDKAGYGEFFGHGLGHGIGLDAHERPRLGPSADDILLEKMVFTVEPGIYLPGWGGVRIEDTVTIAGGKALALTAADKKPLLIGGKAS
ncbi:MAG: aminopeptidase P family protein [Dehalococcoidia bacterium]|nr:aminopeptidase P family protein [Dehalococcoidia bacterium]